MLAQTEMKKNFFAEYGVGARGSVLSSSFVSLANDYSATYWNPAGMAYIRGFSIGGMQYKMEYDREINFASLIFPVASGTRIGLSWQGFLINKIEARKGNTETPDSFFDNLEEAIWLSFSQRLFSRLNIGLNVKYIHQSINGMNGTGWAMDSGLIFELNPKMKIGFVIYDIGAKLSWTTNHTEHYQKLNRLGVSYMLKNDLMVSCAVEGNEQLNQFSVGTEHSLLGPFKFRLGWRNNRFSTGMGIDVKLSKVNLVLNYAIANSKISSGISHICDLSISFDNSRPLKPEVVVISCTKLNVRSGPGVKNIRVAQVFKDQKFVLKGRKDGWLKIEYSKNRNGWIRGNYAEIIR